MTQGAFGGTREEWCERALALLVEEFASIGIVHPAPDERDWRVAVAPIRGQALGVCHHSMRSRDGRTNFITVGTQQAEPIELVHTLAHELLHAFDNLASGHRGRWRRWARVVGIEARSHSRTPAAAAVFVRVVDAIGVPSRHVTSAERSLARARPRASLQKLQCVDADCETQCYVNVGQTKTLLLCGHCNRPMIPARLKQED